MDDFSADESLESPSSRSSKIYLCVSYWPWMREADSQPQIFPVLARHDEEAVVQCCLEVEAGAEIAKCP